MFSIGYFGGPGGTVCSKEYTCLEARLELQEGEKTGDLDQVIVAQEVFVLRILQDKKSHESMQ